MIARMRTMFAVLLLLLGMVLALSAATSAAKTKVSIGLWAVANDHIVGKDLVERFQKENPDIEVNLVLFSGAQTYEEWVKLQMVAGTLDIFAVGDWTAKDYWRQGLLTPIDPLWLGYRSVQDLRKAYLPGAINDFIVGEREVLGLPQEWNSQLLYYNTQMFAEKGIQAPATDATSFIQIAKKLTERRADMTYKVAGFQWYTWDYNLVLTMQWNALLNSYKGSMFDAAGNLAMDNAAGEKALTFWYDLVHTWQVTSPKAGGIADGGAAMQLFGPWYIDYMVRNVPSVDFNVALLPTGEQQVTSMYTWLWAIAGTSPNKEAAAKFMRFALVDNAEWFMNNRGFVIPTANSLKFRRMLDDKRYQPFLNALSSARYMEYIPQFQNVANRLTSMIAQIAIQNPPVAPANALKDTARMIRELLKVR